MAVRRITLLPMTTFDFSTLGAGASCRLVHRHESVLDVCEAREVWLEVRVADRSFDRGTAHVEVSDLVPDRGGGGEEIATMSRPPISLGFALVPCAMLRRLHEIVGPAIRVATEFIQGERERGTLRVTYGIWALLRE